MDSEFNNIKEGDVVFVYRRVNYGWKNYKDFLVSKRVTRVTPKQFLVGTDRYRKSNGSLVASGYTLSFASKKGTDQTKECRDFIRKISLENNINNIVSEIQVPQDSNIHIDLLAKTLADLEEIKERIDKLK